MIGKEFSTATLNISHKICPNFKPINVQEVIERYRNKAEMHLFIEQPHLNENGERVCNIYDCIYPKYLQHENFVYETMYACKQVKQIMDEVEHDRFELKKLIHNHAMRNSDNILANLSWPVEMMINAYGMVRVFQYYHPSSGEV